MLPYFLASSLIFRSVFADGQYVTRPDLSPPRLNITVPAKDGVSPGYIFVGPYSGFTKGDGFDGPEQPAGYIFRDDGDLVWSSMGYLNGWVGNLQVREWRGRPVITGFQGTLDSFHGHGFGHPTVLDDTYENIRDLRGGNHKIISIHEFNLLPSGRALVEIYQPTEMDLSAFSDDADSRWIVDAVFQEIDVESGDLLFEWSSLGHISPEYSKVSLSSGHAGDGHNSSSAWDYFHTNSVDKDVEGNYLISARHASALFKINGKTGEVMWQLGGHNSTFEINDDVLFGFQHDARFVKQRETTSDVEYVSLFDNAARANGHRGGGVEIVHSKSRAKVIRLDKSTWTATTEISLSAPDDLLAPSQGNVQTLPNDNLFVNWGQAGAVTEYRAGDGEVLFHAYLDSDEIGQGVQSYRGFRFEWNGKPRETPAIVARKDLAGSGALEIYASWNGDTEARKWRFYALSASSRPYLLGEVDRIGFETTLRIKANLHAVAFYAEAIGAEGQLLVKTEVVKGQEYSAWSVSHPYREHTPRPIQVELR